jgi:DNA-binding CsgD family transcriptional regulator
MGDLKWEAFARANRMMGETVADPSLWPTVMDLVCEAVGATGGVLLQTDVRTADVPRTGSFDEMMRRYFDGGWQTRDIRAERGVPLLMKGQRVFIDEDIFTREELERSPYINECTLPGGFKWAAGVGFMAGSAMWGLCLHRTFSQAPFDARDASMLQTLPDLLTEVATLSTAVGRVALSSATNALDLVGRPAIALDRFGVVLGVNQAAEAIFDDDFRVRNRRLFASDHRANRDLRALADGLLATPESEPLPALSIVVRRPGKPITIARTLPVHVAARNPFLGARVLLVFSEAKVGARLSADYLGGIFGLTPTEARLATSLAQGHSLELIAHDHKISLATARNQLKAVFLKTDTHKQSELVALLLRL